MESQPAEKPLPQTTNVTRQNTKVSFDVPPITRSQTDIPQRITLDEDTEQNFLVVRDTHSVRSMKTPMSLSHINRNKRKKQKSLKDEMKKVTDNAIVPTSKIMKIRENTKRPMFLSIEQKKRINDESYQKLIIEYKVLRSKEKEAIKKPDARKFKDLKSLKDSSDEIHRRIQLSQVTQRIIAEQIRKRNVRKPSHFQSLREDIEKELMQQKEQALEKFYKALSRVVQVYKKRTFSERRRNSLSRQRFHGLHDVCEFLGVTKQSNDHFKNLKNWENIKECRYIRGHEPESETLPENKDVTSWVFER